MSPRIVGKKATINGYLSENDAIFEKGADGVYTPKDELQRGAWEVSCPECDRLVLRNASLSALRERSLLCACGIDVEADRAPRRSA